MLGNTIGKIRPGTGRLMRHHPELPKRTAGGRGIATPEIANNDKSLPSRDSVRIYLRKMGQTPLLIREQEVEIAKGIEDRVAKLSELLFSFPPGIKTLLELGKRLSQNKGIIIDIIRPEKSRKKITEAEKKEYRRKVLKLMRRVAKLSASELKQKAPGLVKKMNLDNDVIYELAKKTLKRSQTEPKGIARAMKLIDEEKNKFVNANFRLVVSIAKKYTNRGLEFLDLIQDGNIGLMRAALKFNHRRGGKFSTYATWWIRQAITRAIADQGRTIRIPVNVLDAVNKLERLARTHERPGLDELPLEAIAKEMNLPLKKVLKLLKIVPKEPIPLETQIGSKKEGGTLQDVIEDKSAKNPFDQAFESELRETTRKVLATLTPREEKVLRLRFGIGEKRDHILDEVGVEFNVTRERIRQIETKALGKLRHPTQAEKLKPFLDE